MPKFHIEVPHEADKNRCKQAVKIFLESGSHFLTNAEWGCRDGEHKAWIIAEVDSKQEAQGIIPPAYRTGAKIVQINKFKIEEIEEQHK